MFDRSQRLTDSGILVHFEVTYSRKDFWQLVYQHLNNGGESWLRYMVFKPEANKISIHTYNPAFDKFNNGRSSRFDLDYPMALPPVVSEDPSADRAKEAKPINQ